MSDKNKEQESVDSVTDNQSTVDKSKRKFSKAVGVAAPIIMSFSSRPSWGQVVGDNCSFKAAVSGNISQDPNTACIDTRFSTVSLGVFKTNGASDQWGRYGVKKYKGYDFATVFGLTGINITITDNKGVDTGLAPTLLNLMNVNDIVMDGTITVEGDQVRFDEIDVDHNKVWQYITGFLCSVSSVLVYPYISTEITNDWFTENYLPNMKILHGGEYTVKYVNENINPYVF